MKRTGSFLLFIFSVLIFIGCGKTVTEQNSEQSITEEVQTEQEVQSDSNADGSSFQNEVQSETEDITSDQQSVSIPGSTDLQSKTVLYTDDELGIEVYQTESGSMEYFVTNGESIGAFTLDVSSDRILSYEIATWGEEPAFLVLLLKQDSTQNIEILKYDTLGTINVEDPYETLQTQVSMEESGEDSLVLHFMDQEYKVSLGDSELEGDLKDSIIYDQQIQFLYDEEGIYAFIPLLVGEKDLGSFRLYYEFDGVGLNCIDLVFVPSE